MSLIISKILAFDERKNEWMDDVINLHLVIIKQCITM